MDLLLTAISTLTAINIRASGQQTRFQLNPLASENTFQYQHEPISY